MSYIEIKNISKSYKNKNVFNDFSIEIPKGKFVSFIGSYGSGKTTLLKMIAGIERIDKGEILIDGVSPKKLKDELKLGFVFQEPMLLPWKNVIDNINFPLKIIGKNDNTSAIELLKLVELEEKRDCYPNELSGGQQQRTAIGRAVIKNPDILLCDEPTGALDYRTSQDILQLICDINERFGNTIIMVTHNESIKYIANHIFVLHDGRIKEDYMNTERKKVNEVDW